MEEKSTLHVCFLCIFSENSSLACPHSSNLVCDSEYNLPLGKFEKFVQFVVKKNLFPCCTDVFQSISVSQKFSSISTGTRLPRGHRK